ncbi:MAG: hypothetical protein D6805_01075 [Planctomycetota bacterium]|nr:MAG: hypothetical protein D6805_01075 [Planctomycetota bacterium]
MSHFFGKMVDLSYLQQAITGMLAEAELEDMQTIQLEHTPSSVDLGIAEFLEKSKRPRKPKYTLKEVMDWKTMDWELELQLAPEFEEVRTKIQQCQQTLPSTLQRESSQEFRQICQEIQQKALEILKKKISTYLIRTFSAASTNSSLNVSSSNSPQLKVHIAEIDLSKSLPCLIFELWGILNGKTASHLLTTLKEVLNEDYPYLMLELNKLGWMENTCAPSLIQVFEYLRELGGKLGFVVVDQEYRAKLKKFSSNFAPLLFLDRGGAVSYFLR